MTLLIAPKGGAVDQRPRWPLYDPSAIAVDPTDDALLVGDVYGIVRVGEKSDACARVAGQATLWRTRAPADGIGSAAEFNSVLSVAVDSAGAVYAADSECNALRRCTRVPSAETPGEWLYDVKTGPSAGRAVSCVDREHGQLLAAHARNGRTIAVFDLTTASAAAARFDADTDLHTARPPV